MLTFKNKTNKVYNVLDWLVLQEFYELVYRSRLLLLSATSFEEMRYSKEALDEMVDFLVNNVLKKNIEPDDLYEYELSLNYKQIQSPEGYNEVYYQKLLELYTLQTNLFNYIIDGRYREFRKKNPHF